MSDKELSIVIPAYNEEQSIGRVVQDIKRLHNEAEVIVVDDGSQDSTKERAEEAGAKVVQHPYNIGNGAAVKTGIRAASRKYVILMDGDGQHRPEEISKIAQELEEYDLVVGARDAKGQANWWRAFANTVYNKLASYITRRDIKDLTSGFRGFERKTVLKFLYLFPNTFSYPTTSTLAYLKSGRSLKYVPITTKKRLGKSKIHLVSDGLRFLFIILKIVVFYEPMKVFLPLSFGFFSIALARYLTYALQGSPKFSNSVVLLWSVSVIIFCIGLLSEQITQLRYDRIETGSE